MQVAVITGGSSGIGLATAKLLSIKGYKVYELSRRDVGRSGITHITVDVTDRVGIKAAIDKIINEAGKIDVLINNAGFGISGAVEFTEMDEAKKQFDVNYFGALNMIQEVLSHMRKQKSGKIINVSSVAGVLPVPFQAFYSGAKAAINSLTLALRNEVKPFKIKVCAVMPGDTATGFTAVREKNEAGMEVYTALSKSVAKMEKDEEKGKSPDFVAKVIYKAVRKKNPKPLITAGFMYKLLVVASRILPTRLVNKIIGGMYAKSK